MCSDIPDVHSSGAALCAAHAEINDFVSAYAAELLAATLAFVPGLDTVGYVILALVASFHGESLFNENIYSFPQSLKKLEHSLLQFVGSAIIVNHNPGIFARA
jgi:hypothetical protein